MPDKPERKRKTAQGPGGDAAGGGERPLVTLRGQLQCRHVGRGTGSEHVSWVMAGTRHGPLLLKPLEAHPFELPEPPAPEGSEVEAEGYLLEGELRYLRLRVV